MSDFNEQLSRMKSLMTYGKVEEEKRPSNYTIEYKATAADGLTYGIIKECSKYYIKYAPTDKEMVAEAYQYIGGFPNKKNFEYTSYANALKNFELKLSSINEAHDAKINIETLNPFRRNEVIAEGTDKMENEIARCRQIMYNASMLMNESTEIGATPFKNQPEAAKGHSGDKDAPFTDEVKPDMEFAGKKSECPKCQGDPYIHGDKCCKGEKGEEITVKDAVASAHPAGGKVVRVNEGLDAEEGCCDEELDALLGEDEEDLLTGGEDEYGFDEDEAEEARQTAEGDMEGEYGDEMIPMDDEPVKPLDKEEEGDVDECGIGMEECGGICEEDEDETEEEPSDEEKIDDEEEDTELDDEEETADDEEKRQEIEDELAEENPIWDELPQEIKDKLIDERLSEEGEEESSDEEEFDDEEEEPSDEEEFDDEEETEEDGDDTLSFDAEDFEDSDEGEEEGDVDECGIGMEECGGICEKHEHKMPVKPWDKEEEGDKYADEIDNLLDAERDASFERGMNEGKKKYMNEMVNSIVNEVLNEERLNVFGDHPGYRKSPIKMKNGEEHSEKPFGLEIGDGKPYGKATIEKMTDKILSSLKESGVLKKK